MLSLPARVPIGVTVMVTIWRALKHAAYRMEWHNVGDWLHGRWVRARDRRRRRGW